MSNPNCVRCNGTGQYYGFKSFEPINCGCRIWDKEVPSLIGVAFTDEFDAIEQAKVRAAEETKTARDAWAQIAIDQADKDVAVLKEALERRAKEKKVADPVEPPFGFKPAEKSWLVNDIQLTRDQYNKFVVTVDNLNVSRQAQITVRDEGGKRYVIVEDKGGYHRVEL
jgi:hypothetical protein